jgi:hypothetical protein
MDIKFSQLPPVVTIKKTDTFPILENGEDNKLAPVLAIYYYMSGDTIVRLHSAFTSNSSKWIDASEKAIDVYTKFSVNSSLYIKETDFEVSQWTQNYNYTNALSGFWQRASTYTSTISSKAIVSDTNPTLFPNSSAIKNIIAITQTNYDLLTFKDPQTFYVIASV